MIFSAEQSRAVRQGKVTAALVPVSEKVRAGSLRVDRRGMPAGEDGARPPKAIETVIDQGRDGERAAVVFTVLAVTDLQLEAVTLAQARACGHRTSQALRDAWTLEHPRISYVRLVAFALGDLRDTPRLIARGWPDYTSDRSRAMRGEPEAISSSELAGLSADAQQRWLRLQADAERRAARSTMAERLAAIQAGTVARGAP